MRTGQGPDEAEAYLTACIMSMSGRLCMQSAMKISDGPRKLGEVDQTSRALPYGIVEVVTNWEYARFDYRAAGSFGRDKFMDWNATFHHPGGAQRWGTDERFDDLRHLNRAGADGWQAYDRAAMYVANEPHRLFGVTYSLRRPVS